MNHIKKRLKNKTGHTCSGQVSIFVLFMFSMLFMFFGMAINIGMLVHHKMNLQNAADLAALAAAAEQARILNMIGWKNYELRKNWKSLMYNYWVGFNDRHKNFPDPRPYYFGNRGKENLEKGGDQSWIATFQTAPSYCFGDRFLSSDFLSSDRRLQKICEADDLPSVFARPPSGIISLIARFSLVAGPVLEALKRLADQREQMSHETYAYYNAVNLQESAKDYFTHRQRADIIFDTYLNPANGGSLVGLLNSDIPYDQRLTGIPSWPSLDDYFQRQMPHISRPVAQNEYPQNFHYLAYLTALKNLNQALKANFEFQVLRPQNGYLQIIENRLDFTMFYTELFNMGRRRYVNRYNEIPDRRKQFLVGIQKDPAVKTFYALKLSSRPFLPFLPGRNTWTLTAFSAAQPFGSRIGDPNFNERDYTKRVTIHINQTPRTYLIPHMYLDENLSIDNTRVLYQLKREGGGLVDGTFYEPQTHPTIDTNLPVTAPNRWDALRYIFPTPQTSLNAIHPSDSIQPFSYSATDLQTSWQNRDGYSIKLIPLQSILPYLPDTPSQSAQTIFH